METMVSQVTQSIDAKINEVKTEIGDLKPEMGDL